METAIALLHQSSLPLKYWFDALATSVFLINRMPSTALHHKTPFEVLFHSKPDYSFFRVFGCQCFPWLKPYTKHKLQPRSVLCVFLGYHPSYKGYRCLDPSTGRIYISRHVLFHENVFPYAAPELPTTSFPPPTLTQIQSFFWSSESSKLSSPETSTSVSSIPIPSIPLSCPNNSSSQFATSLATSESTVSPSCSTSAVVSHNPSSVLIQSLEVVLPPVSTTQPPRARTLPHPMVTRSKSKGLLSTPHCLSAITSSTFTEPTTLIKRLFKSLFGHRLCMRSFVLFKLSRPGPWSLYQKESMLLVVNGFSSSNATQTAVLPDIRPD